METPTLAQQWQDRFDNCFPHGCLVSYENDPAGYSYPVPRPEVVGLKGMNPVVFLDVPSWGRDLTGPLTSWTQLRDDPVRVVRVTMDMHGEDDSVLLWSGNVSPAQARSLAPAREASLRASAQSILFRRDDEE